MYKQIHILFLGGRSEILREIKQSEKLGIVRIIWNFTSADQ
jgi:hypothetical protein